MRKMIIAVGLVALLGLVLVGCYRNEPLEAEIGVSSTDVLVGEVVELHALTNYPGEVDCYWKFGDGETDTGEVVNYDFKGAGIHCVELTVIRGPERLDMDVLVGVWEPAVSFYAQVEDITGGEIYACDDVVMTLRFVPGEVSRVIIDWGDGTGDELKLPILNGSTGYRSAHKYEDPGDYEPTVSVDGTEPMCRLGIKEFGVSVVESTDVLVEIHGCGCWEETLPSGIVKKHCD